MNTELFIGLVSILGAITSLIAAITSFRRDERKSQLENKAMQAQEADRMVTMQAQVQEDTAGLYRRLSEQYEELNEKDKKLLRTITFVIRNMIVLDRTISDLLSEMEIRWDEHHQESEEIDCPFYDQMSEYLYARVKGIENIVQETMEETDHLLFNGSGPMMTKDKE